MKQNYFRNAVLSIIMVTIFSFTMKATINTAFANTDFAVFVDDANFKIGVIVTNGQPGIHVSFNGNEGTTGTLKIINANNQLVNQQEIGLVQQPNFTTIRLDEFAPATYTAELTTPTGVHTTHFTIK